jgi:hypothetical protein
MGKQQFDSDPRLRLTRNKERQFKDSHFNPRNLLRVTKKAAVLFAGFHVPDRQVVMVVIENGEILVHDEVVTPSSGPQWHPLPLDLDAEENLLRQLGSGA